MQGGTFSVITNFMKPEYGKMKGGTLTKEQTADLLVQIMKNEMEYTIRENNGKYEEHVRELVNLIKDSEILNPESHRFQEILDNISVAFSFLQRAANEIYASYGDASGFIIIIRLSTYFFIASRDMKIEALINYFCIIFHDTYIRLFNKLFDTRIESAIDHIYEYGRNSLYAFHFIDLCNNAYRGKMLSLLKDNISRISRNHTIFPLEYSSIVNYLSVLEEKVDKEVIVEMIEFYALLIYVYHIEEETVEKFLSWSTDLVDNGNPLVTLNHVNDCLRNLNTDPLEEILPPDDYNKIRVIRPLELFINTVSVLNVHKEHIESILTHDKIIDMVQLKTAVVEFVLKYKQTGFNDEVIKLYKNVIDCYNLDEKTIRYLKIDLPTQSFFEGTMTYKFIEYLLNKEYKDVLADTIPFNDSLLDADDENIMLHIEELKTRGVTYNDEQIEELMVKVSNISSLDINEPEVVVNGDNISSLDINEPEVVVNGDNGNRNAEAKQDDIKQKARRRSSKNKSLTDIIIQRAIYRIYNNLMYYNPITALQYFEKIPVSIVGTANSTKTAEIEQPVQQGGAGNVYSNLLQNDTFNMLKGLIEKMIKQYHHISYFTAQQEKIIEYCMIITINWFQKRGNFDLHKYMNETFLMCADILFAINELPKLRDHILKLFEVQDSDSSNSKNNIWYKVTSHKFNTYAIRLISYLNNNIPTLRNIENEVADTRIFIQLLQSINRKMKLEKDSKKQGNNIQRMFTRIIEAMIVNLNHNSVSARNILWLILQIWDNHISKLQNASFNDNTLRIMKRANADYVPFDLALCFGERSKISHFLSVFTYYASLYPKLRKQSLTDIKDLYSNYKDSCDENIQPRDIYNVYALTAMVLQIAIKEYGTIAVYTFEEDVGYDELMRILKSDNSHLIFTDKGDPDMYELKSKSTQKIKRSTPDIKIDIDADSNADYEEEEDFNGYEEEDDGSIRSDDDEIEAAILAKLTGGFSNISGGAKTSIESIINMVIQIAMRPELRARYITNNYYIGRKRGEEVKFGFGIELDDETIQDMKHKLYALQYWFNPSMISKLNTSSYSDVMLIISTLSRLNYFILDSIPKNVGLQSFEINEEVALRTKVKVDLKEDNHFIKLTAHPHGEINEVAIRNYNFKTIAKARQINVSTDIFKYIPLSHLTLQYFFSPQKDIYNVTRIACNDLDRNRLLDAPFVNFSPSYKNGTYTISYNELMERIIGAGADSYYMGDSCIHLRSITSFSYSSSMMYKFVEMLISSSIETIFSSSNTHINNLGFDIGSSNDTRMKGASLYKNLTGGARDFVAVNDTFCYRFINVNNITSSNNELELLASAYNIDNSKSEDEYNDGKILYASLFKSDFGSGTSMLSYRHMFTLIMNYFHKFNVSFASMFDQLCFPSILFNASALRLFTDRMSALSSNIFASFISDSTAESDVISYKNKLFSVIMTYLRGFTKTGNVLDISHEYTYQLKFKDRRSIVSIDIAMNNIKNSPTGPSFDGNITLWLANQYASISIANSFFFEFIRYIDINGMEDDNNDTKYSKNRIIISALFPSNLCGTIRHLDAITTYANIIFMLLKQTTYYDHENDAEVTFFNNTEMEPFSVT